MVARIAQAAMIIGIAALFGLAYSAIGYGLGNFISYFGTPQWVFETWVFAWLAGGVLAVAMWTVRWAGVGTKAGAR